MKLGKRQTGIFVLIGISSSSMYYATRLREVGSSFSDGIFIGFLSCITLLGSLGVLYLWGDMLYKNLKAAWKEKI